MAKLNKQYVINGSAGIERLNLYTTLEEVDNLGKKIHLADWNIDCYYAIGDINVEYATKKRLSINGVVYAGLKESVFKRKKVYIFEKGLTDFIIPEGATKITYRLCGGGSGMYLSSAPINQQTSGGNVEIETPTFMKVESLNDIYEHNTATDPVIVNLFNSDTTGEVSKLSGRSSFIVFPDSTTINAKGGELNILSQNTFTKDKNIVRKSIGLGKLTNSLITDKIFNDPDYINNKFLSLQPEYNSAKANWFPGVYTFIDGVTKEEYLPNSTVSANDITISPTSGFVKFSGLYTKEDNTIDYSLAFNPTNELLDSNIKKALINVGSNLSSSTEAIATIRENLKRRVNRLPGQGKVIEIFNNEGVFSFTRFYNDFFSIANDIYGNNYSSKMYPYYRLANMFSLSIPKNYNFFKPVGLINISELDPSSYTNPYLYPDLISHNDVNMPPILGGIHGRAYSDNSTLIRPRNFQAEKIFANLPTEREWNQSDFGNNLYYVDRLKLLGLSTLDLLNYDPVAFYTVIFENSHNSISTLADASYNNGKDTKYRGMYIDYVTNAKDSENNVLYYDRYYRTRPMDEKFYPNLHYIGALNLSIDTDIKSPDIDNFETLNDNENTFGLHVNILDCCTNDLKLDPSTYEYEYINGLGIDLNNLRIKPRGYTVYYNDNKGNEISKYEIKYGASVKLNHLKYFEDYITEWQSYNNRNFYTLEGLNDFAEVMNGCLVGTPSEEKVGEFKVGPNETYKAGDVLRIGVGKRGKIYHDRLKWEIDDMIEERICEEESDGICILEIETYRPVRINNLTAKVDGEPIKNQFGLFDNITEMSSVDKSKFVHMLIQYDFVDASSLGKDALGFIGIGGCNNKTVLFANTVPYNRSSAVSFSLIIETSIIYGKLFNSSTPYSIETNNIPRLDIDYTNRASKNIFSEISGLLLNDEDAFVHDVRSFPVLNLKKMTVKYYYDKNNYRILKNQNLYNYTTQPQKIILRDLNYMRGLYGNEYNYSSNYFKDVDLFKVYNMLFNYKAFRDNKVVDLYYSFFNYSINNIIPNLKISSIKNSQMKLYNGNMYLNYDTDESVPLNYRNIRLRFKQAITTSKPNIVENLYINIEPTTVPNINDFAIEMYSESTGKCVLRGMDIIKKINIFAISNIKDIIFIGGNLDLEVNRFIVNNSKVEDLSMINVTLVTNTQKPFISFMNCSILKKLPTVLNLENTFSLKSCFYKCKSLTEDEYRRFFDNFIQDKLTDISGIFHSSSINFIPDFKSSKITEMRYAFSYISIDLDKSSLSVFDNKSADFYNLFYMSTLYSNSVDMIQTLLNKLGEVDFYYSTYIFSNTNFRVNGVDYINKLSMTINSSGNNFSTTFYGLNRAPDSQTIHEFYIKINSSSSANLSLTKFFGDGSKIDILNINTDKVTTQLTSIGYTDIKNIHELRLNINLNNYTSYALFNTEYIPTIKVTRSCAVYLTLDKNMSQDSYNKTFTADSLPNISKFVIYNVNKNLNYMFDIDDSVRYEGLMETISNCARYPTENFTINVRAKADIIDAISVQDAVDWYNSTNESDANLTVNITYI